LPIFHKGFDLPIKNILHTGSHHHYRYGHEGETEEDFSTRRAAELEQQIIEEGPETVAAFIAEPVMGAGGAVLPPKGYFEKIQAVLKKYDVLMIADEVITGFHRTGNTFASQTYGIKPDILVMAKALSSAYMPISAVMINEEMYSAISDYADENSIMATGFTYSGHPVSAAVALETLKIYDDTDIGAHVRKVSKLAVERVEALASHPLVGEARGVGLIGAVELVKDKETKESFGPEVANFCGDACIRHKVILRPCAAKRMAYCPPLIIKEDQLNTLFDGLEVALDETLEYTRTL
jgi:4-aminobutyrate--pyruvate transaminase